MTLYDVMIRLGIGCRRWGCFQHSDPDRSAGREDEVNEEDSDSTEGVVGCMIVSVFADGETLGVCKSWW